MNPQAEPQRVIDPDGAVVDIFPLPIDVLKPALDALSQGASAASSSGVGGGELPAAPGELHELGSGERRQKSSEPR